MSKKKKKNHIPSNSHSLSPISLSEIENSFHDSSRIPFLRTRIWILLLFIPFSFFFSIHLWKIETYMKNSPRSTYDALIGLRILYTRDWKQGPCSRKWIVGFTCRILYQRGWLHWKWKRNDSSKSPFFSFFFFHDRVLYPCSRHKVSHRSTRIPNYAIEDASLSARDCTIDYNC